MYLMYILRQAGDSEISKGRVRDVQGDWGLGQDELLVVLGKGDLSSDLSLAQPVL